MVPFLLSISNHAYLLSFYKQFIFKYQMHTYFPSSGRDKNVGIIVFESNHLLTQYSKQLYLLVSALVVGMCETAPAYHWTNSEFMSKSEHNAFELKETRYLLISRKWYGNMSKVLTTLHLWNWFEKEHAYVIIKLSTCLQIILWSFPRMECEKKVCSGKWCRRCMIYFSLGCGRTGGHRFISLGLISLVFTLASCGTSR